MNRMIAAWMFLLVTVAPTMAWANPNTDSPEPSFWIFALMGALPLVVLAVRRMRQEQAAKAPVDGRQ